MDFKCRLCGQSCSASQGRGAHESYCAKQKGAQLFGSGPDRHFILNGKRIDAPNSKNTAPAAHTLTQPSVEPAKRKRNNPAAHTARAKSVEKARVLASMMGDQVLRVKEIQVLYEKMVGKFGLCKSIASGFVRLHPETFQSMGAGRYKAINGQPNGQARFDFPQQTTEIVKTTSDEHPSESENDSMTPEQIFAQDSALSHGAVTTIQKTAALLQFATLMENIGPSSALAMIAGMSKIGKALNGRR